MNVVKLNRIFGIYDEGFIDFNKRKHDNITKDIQNNYSASKTSKRLSIMNDLMSKTNVSNNYKVFRVLDNKCSIVMSKHDIKKVCNCYSGLKLVI